MHWRSIYVQYPVETMVFVAILFLAFSNVMRRSEPRRVLALFAGLNILRFGGGAAALWTLARSGGPAFLVQVAIGDFATAAMAVVALALLLRRSDKALVVTALMNAFGLLHIVVSEGWIGYWERVGIVTRTSFFHGPTVGAALYSAVHLYSFVYISRASAADGTTDAQFPTI